ncbi:MAG: hypothetical protein HQL50_06310 [Magnetococcales bacterium]|nr:hypothetical protein [Magnetococcales bacterium]
MANNIGIFSRQTKQRLFKKAHLNVLINHPSWRHEKARERIKDLARLEPGWAGPESYAPPTSIIKTALTFLDHLPPDIPTPYPVAIGAGELTLFWEDDDQQVLVDLGFGSDRSYNYYAYDATIEIAEDDCPIDRVDRKDNQLLVLIRRQKEPEQLSDKLWESS